ncbi:hypothetical protein [Serratia marcescens]|uniref:Uncharacterized protein n=1 Tax=Serratia marcescens TaxID=615 RepID=A0ABD5IP63_SERMA|nr:hypothetical protein [Serratia marcescens]MDX7085924.1 hypothetical protein [Serratia marcescens]
MTQTITTERQQFEQWWHEEYCHLECSSEAAFVKHVAWEAMKKGREILASREAQPVAIVESSAYVTAAQIIGDEPPMKAVKELYKGALVIGQHLYTAPPAPAVNLTPDFEAWFNSPEAGFRVVNFHIQHELQLKSWNACRAAMLAQPVSQGCKLVPVPTVKKFIPVSSVSSTVNGTEPFPAALTCEEAAALDGTIFLSHLKPGGMVQVYAAVGKDDDRELIAFNPKDFKFTAPDGGNG